MYAIENSFSSTGTIKAYKMKLHAYFARCVQLTIKITTFILESFFLRMFMQFYFVFVVGRKPETRRETSKRNKDTIPNESKWHDDVTQCPHFTSHYV